MTTKTKITIAIVVAAIIAACIVSYFLDYYYGAGILALLSLLFVKRRKAADYTPRVTPINVADEKGHTQVYVQPLDTSTIPDEQIPVERTAEDIQTRIEVNLSEAINANNTSVNNPNTVDNSVPVNDQGNNTIDTTPKWKNDGPDYFK